MQNIEQPLGSANDRTAPTASVLVVDDDSATCELLEAKLTREGLRVVCCNDGEAALRVIEEDSFDVVLADVLMDDMSGLELCSRVAGVEPDLPVVLITGDQTMERAIGAIRAGAYDFIAKPVELNHLVVTVERAVEHRRLNREVKLLRTAVQESARFENLVGQSSAMRKVYALLDRVGRSDASVLIGGESGTGKELVAKAIHERSARRAGPFVAINCAAFPATLLESELFGHEKGAFTDAKSGREGLFSRADGGTLFLDEIGEMPIEMQPKLLRALQERTVRPVGGNTEIPFNARVVTASNRDLEERVDQGAFRADLYYRINVVRIDVPPLRERGSDILLLARHFLDRFAERFGKEVIDIHPAAASKLMAYDWPGNVRELENCIERAVALTRSRELTLEDIPDNVRTFKASRFAIDVDSTQELLTMAEVEKRYLHRTLSMVSGNKSRAARILGVDRRTLYRMMERYEKES
jgi:two-component system, NtrC family, response regulator HydG